MATWKSLLGGVYPRDLIQGLEKKHNEALRKMLLEPCNSHCAECGVRGTSWASVSLGVFLCEQCVDVHRALGTDISKTKACMGVAVWGPDEVERMQALGNAKAQDLFLAADNIPVLNSSASKEDRVNHCLKKYRLCLWKASNVQTMQSSCKTMEQDENRKTSVNDTVDALLEEFLHDFNTAGTCKRLSTCKLDCRNDPAKQEALDWIADCEKTRDSHVQTEQSIKTSNVANGCTTCHEIDIDAILGSLFSGDLSPDAERKEAACLPNPTPLPPPVRLSRQESDTLWENFGTW